MLSSLREFRARLAIFAVLVSLGIGLTVWRSMFSDYSNIYPEDYVGPDACSGCHEENHALWQAHPHRTMNQNPSEQTVKGDFSGQKIEYGAGYAIFERAGEDFLMSIYQEDEEPRLLQVTRTIGSLYVQYYAGKQILGPESTDHRAYKLETKLPFGYSIQLDRWLPEIYFDSTVYAEADFLDGTHRDYIYSAPLHSWNATCLYCHNSYPYVARLWKQREASANIWRAGFPQSAVNWRGEQYDQGGLVLPGPAVKRSKNRQEIRAVHSSELVTVGISCESCHFGGREHAVNNQKISFVPRADDLTIRRPKSAISYESDREDPFVVNSICFQCHNANLHRYPNLEPAVNSSESIAMSMGYCYSQIKCTDCHDPHERGAESGGPENPGHVEACLKCHQHLDEPVARSSHSRHSEVVSCLDCHMPRIVAGLDTVARSHAITVPGDETMIRAGSLNACNLCHLDRPIAWTLGELANGWDRESNLGSNVEDWEAYGDGGMSPVGEVWLRSLDRFVRMTAVDAYSRSPLVDNPLPALLEGLGDAYAFNRVLALIALEKELDRRVTEEEYELVAPASRRRQQIQSLDAYFRASQATRAGH